MSGTLTRLVTARARQVYRHLKQVSEDKAFMKGLDGTARASLLTAVATGAPLETLITQSPIVVDSVTDSVLSNFEAALQAFIAVATDKIVTPAPEAIQVKSWSAALLRLVIPKGAQAVQDLDMPDELKALHDIAEVLATDATARDLVKKLGVGWMVAQLTAHLKPYADAVRASDGRDLTGDTAKFNDALNELDVDVRSRHKGDVALRDHVFKAYDKELAEQQADLRASRKRRAAAKAAAAQSAEPVAEPTTADAATT